MLETIGSVLLEVNEATSVANVFAGQCRAAMPCLVCCFLVFVVLVLFRVLTEVVGSVGQELKRLRQDIKTAQQKMVVAFQAAVRAHSLTIESVSSVMSLQQELGDLEEKCNERIDEEIAGLEAEAEAEADDDIASVFSFDLLTNNQQQELMDFDFGCYGGYAVTGMHRGHGCEWIEVRLQ